VEGSFEEGNLVRFNVEDSSSSKEMDEAEVFTEGPVASKTEVNILLLLTSEVCETDEHGKNRTVHDAGKTMNQHTIFYNVKRSLLGKHSG